MPLAGVVRLMVAVLVPEPGAPVTVRGITKLEEVTPLLSAPTVQVTACPTALQPPGIAPTLKSAGTVSDTTTPVAFCGPWLVADRVRVTASPVA